MSKYFLTTVLLLSAVFSFGQSKKFSFKFGSEYTLPRKSEDLAFTGNDRDGIVNLSIKKDELSILRFDTKTLNQTDEKTIEMTDATRNFNSEAVIEMNKNYYWFHSDWDKKEGIEKLYYEKIDVTTGKVIKSEQKVLEASKIVGTTMASGFYQFKTVNKYKYETDVTQKVLLVSYRLSPEEKNDKKSYDKIGFFVFDENMNKLWGSEFTMPYTEAIMDNNDFSVDSKGNAYLLAKVYDDEKRREKDKSTGLPAYHFELMKFSKDNKLITRSNITVGDYFVKQPTLVENSLHEMILATTYSKKAKSNGTDGVFLSAIGADGKVIKYKNGFYEFPLAELEKFESARSKRKMERKDDYEAPNLSVRNIVLEADGGVLIVCEEYYVVSTYHSDSRGFGGYYTYTYYYEDILVSKINTAGIYEWLRKIPKKQRGSNGRGTMGFKLISDESGYYFLYLDNLKNMALAEDEVPKYHVDGFGGQVIVTKLDTKGVMSKELLFDTRDEEVMVFPSQFRGINKNQFIGRAKVKKNLYMPLLITVN